jgi:hypothetical protein
MQVPRFLDLKLGDYKGYHIQFHFFSMNKGVRHLGLTEKVSLILDNRNGVNKLKENQRSNRPVFQSTKQLEAEIVKLR